MGDPGPFPIPPNAPVGGGTNSSGDRHVLVVQQATCHMFTVSQTQRGYIFPATHYASSSTNPALPPMGLRVRLCADFDLTPFHG